jgi:hypothetical protein
MKYLVIIAVTGFVMMVVVGCAQGAGSTPSGSTEQTNSPRESREPPTTTEETTILSGLVCPNDEAVARTLDYAMGAKGKKGNPVEVARREFSKKIREGDTVEIADRSRGQNAMATVRVIREGRVVALIEYRRAGGGWLQDYYEACANF